MTSDERISTLNALTIEALSMAQNLMNSTSITYTATTSPPPTANALLRDTTLKILTPPEAPEYPSPSSEVFPAMPDAGTFSDTLAEPPVSIGTPSLNFSEAQTSWVIDYLKTAIERLWNEGTGFDDVEQDIYDKGAEKDLQALRDAEDAIISSFAARGFRRPNDILDRALEETNAKYDEIRMQRNADIPKSMMDYAQKNVQFGINAGLEGEALLMGYASDIANRSLNAAKATASFALEVFKANVTGNNAKLMAKRETMKGAVTIEESLLSAYHAENNAKRAQLEVYVSTLSTLYDTYKSALSGYREELKSEKALADVTMSFRRVKFRETLASLRSTLETSIVNLETWLATEGLNANIKTSNAMYYAHLLAASLSALQVTVQDADQSQEEKIIT